jgi:hypothetical protein
VNNVMVNCSARNSSLLSSCYAPDIELASVFALWYYHNRIRDKSVCLEQSIAGKEAQSDVTHLYEREGATGSD